MTALIGPARCAPCGEDFHAIERGGGAPTCPECDGDAVWVGEPETMPDDAAEGLVVD
jgi:predicted Zn-ribbon and HTH transcriptional regulator